MSSAPEVSWLPDPARAAASQLAAFQRHCELRTGTPFADWLAFHRFSIENLGQFWTLFIEWSGLDIDGDLSPAVTSTNVEAAEFFPAVRLSVVEHLLDGRGASDAAAAVVECHEDAPPTTITRGELRRRVARAAAGLLALGVREGDRVAGLVAHDANTITMALAATGIGATWSSCGPELAADAVLARFAQLTPVVLVATSAIRQDGALRAQLEKARQVAASLPSLRHTVVLGEADAHSTSASGLRDWPTHVLTLDALCASGDSGLERWPRFPFDHPLYVLYSSGTTGPPKAIVHGAGGTLLEHLKEHRLHGDLTSADRLYFQTTCGWMMWHWTVSALATGASIVTYDGSVAAPTPDALWRLVAATETTAFGASPAFVQYCRDSDVQPRAHDLSALRVFLSTGSVLAEPHFDWIAERVGPIPVQSISGGTDIIGCFVLGNPLLPVWRGESQCVSLGMDVRALEDSEGGPAELVCATPFPSRPVAFLNDGDGQRRHEAYFSQHPGFWTHGDFIELSPRGSVRVLGRSDGVLKVRGVRIGPAEITSVVEAMPEVREAMAVEQSAPSEPGGARIVLLVVLAAAGTLDRGLTHRIKRSVRDATSADHVPSVVLELPALPVTLNGKRSERAARDAIAGRVPLNAAALRNVEVLDVLRTHEALRVH